MSKSIKKLFVFFGIFAACLILCLCALSACDDVVQTAEAYTAIRTDDGVVRPNVLPYYDFSSLTYKSSLGTLSEEGLFTSYSSIVPSADGSITFGFSSSTFSVFTVGLFAPVAGYYALSVSCPTFSLTGTSSDHISVYIKDNNTNITDISSSGGSTYTDSIFRVNSSSMLSAIQYHGVGSFLRFSFVLSGVGTFSGSMTLKYLKLECFDARPSSYQYSFSGFAIPGITYDDSSSSGGTNTTPWDDWDGFVNANILTEGTYQMSDTSGWDFDPGTVSVLDGVLHCYSANGTTYTNISTEHLSFLMDNKITVSCYIEDLVGSASLSVVNIGATFDGTTNELGEGLNFVTYTLTENAGGSYWPYLSISASSNTSFKIVWAKMEIGDIFTGFAPDPSDSGSSVGWNGVVNRNLISNSDLYAQPIYVTANTPSFDDNNVWVSRIGTLFDYAPNPYPVAPSAIDIEYTLPVSNATDYTFTLSAETTATRVLITLTSGLNTVSLDLASTDMPSGAIFKSLVFPRSDLSTSLTIRIQSFSSSTSTFTMYFTKLEQGALFTGYYPIDHSDSKVIKDNLLSNYDFRSVPVAENIDEVITDKWVVDGENYHFTTISQQTYGLWLTSVNTVSMYYQTTLPTAPTSAYMTFALRCVSGSGDTFYIGINRGDNDPYNYAVAGSAGIQNIVISFPASQSVRIELLFLNDADCYLYYAKLEDADTFSGFCASSELIRQEGYDAGYASGFTDGYEQYANRSYELVFNVSGSQLVIPQGWADFGFSSADELDMAFFTIVPAYYTSRGYTIVSSGYWTYDSSSPADGTIDAVSVYCSRYEVNVDTLDNYFNLYKLNIYENETWLTAKDDDFNADYLNYPVNRTVTLTIANLGVDSSLLYNNFVYSDGFNMGYAEGHADGVVDGIARGRGEAVQYYSSIESTGGWLGFISAFVDVPVMVITNLLDWDFFGFNLLNIIKIMVLFSLTFMVLRLVTKGRTRE